MKASQSVVALLLEEPAHLILVIEMTKANAVFTHCETGSAGRTPAFPGFIQVFCSNSMGLPQCGVPC